MAHYLEHLAFKGTRRIGTTDYAAEKEKLAQLDRLFEQLQATTDERQRQALITEFAAVQQAADRYVIRNQYGQIVQQAGAWVSMQPHLPMPPVTSTVFPPTNWNCGCP